MSSIKIIGEDNQVLEPVNQTLCEICQKQFSNYVCPRCNLRYCSLACYKDLQHADCTESFYKDSVTAEIQNRELDKDSKSKMLEMLKRLEEENDPNDLLDSDDEDDEQDNELMQRFANIDIENTDPDLIWDLLSDKERLEFEQALKSGDWNKLDIPTYQPWWKHQVSLIQDSQQDDQDDRPVMPKTVPDFTKMTQPATRSSPHLAWNLLHLLGTYSYLMRHSLGDLLEDPEDTVKVCEELSVNVLYSKAADCPFQSVGDVVEDLTERIIDRENTSTSSKREFSTQRRYDLRLLLLQDLESLMNDCIRAMYDFWQAINQMANAKKKNKKSLLLAARKLYFYLAAAGYLDHDRRQVIHMAIQGETTRVQTEKEEFLRDFEAAQDAIKKHQQQQQQANKIKIQELE
ncbi:hypothetical protein V8B55DRAFT_1601305 [Mucor lusitanicus]|uniref:HIT-type domain-containing protein n=2 Tax=Mucor circinelloides f. lusitanicus TaxID=29924 RepID=A0A168P3K8_MUCCL|nr:hypothetical protein FB192DRAFT_1333968 [Mucor lusitanicus]OAD07118.1 hypothetical protein MUCCIDRAFT_107721 [Mucor lusitanicus CBS 277.49]